MKINFMNLLCIALTIAVISSRPVFAEEAAAAEAPAQISGDSRLTLELQGVSIFDVFKILSKKSGLNIVAGKNVQGQVSIFLQDVPVRDALKTILQSQGLASVDEAGIVKVMTEEEYLRKYGRPYEDSRQTQSFNLQHGSVETLAGKLFELKSAYGKILTEPRTNTLMITEIPEVLDEMRRLVEQSDQPQESEVFKLNYTRVEDIEPKLKTFMEGAGGKLEIDKRSNRIIVFDIPDKIERVRALVKAFDVKTAQVLIQAKIVEVRLTDAYRKGIDWQEIVEQVGNFNTLQALAPLTVGAPTGAAALATLALGEGQDDLQVLFQLLEQVGKTNLLSSPRITVMNNEEAKLAVATREPFVSQTVVQTVNSTNTADNVQFVDVGVTLKVQPKISHDHFVEMKIKPEVSSSNSSFELQGVSEGSDTAFTRTRIPIVTTQELETTVQIKSGNTLIIGGLIQDSQGKVSSRLPLLSAIPFVGRLFESKANDFSKTELVIFLTPLIVNPDEDFQAEHSRFLNSKDQSKPFDVFGGYSTDIKYDTLIERRHPYWEGSLKDEMEKEQSYG
jgi:type II secretory pathway component GspD/PulD (secretin)